MTAVRAAAGQDGWYPTPKYVLLGCPICKRTVMVLEGCSAWCTRNRRHALGTQRWRDQLGGEWPSLTFRPRFQGYPTWSGVRIGTPADQGNSSEKVTEGDVKTLL